MIIIIMPYISSILFQYFEIPLGHVLPAPLKRDLSVGLCSSGQVSILTSGGGGIPDEDDEYYEDDPDWEPATASPRSKMTACF